LFILATWFLLAVARLLSDNPGLACSDLAAWTKMDTSVEDQAFFEEQQISRSFIPSCPSRGFLFQLVSSCPLYIVWSTFALPADVILM